MGWNQDWCPQAPCAEAPEPRPCPDLAQGVDRAQRFRAGGGEAQGVGARACISLGVGWAPPPPGLLGPGPALGVLKAPAPRRRAPLLMPRWSGWEGCEEQ